MGDVVRLPLPSPASGHARRKDDPRAKEAALLRHAIESRGAAFGPGDQEKVAGRVDGFVARHGEARGRGGIKELCGRIWPGGDENPARRRRDIRTTKKPGTFLDLVDRIARASGGPADDMLLEAFRGTRPDGMVQASLRGAGPEPELERFWSVLSDTLHALAASVSRVEGLEAHLERMVALHGTYDLMTGTIRRSLSRLLDRPLANWSANWCEFPPVPSVVLFAEPKSPTVERTFQLRDPEQALPVRATVMREVRLAVGPVDNVLVPGPLFEIRSVLELRTADGPLRVRCPWLNLDAEEDVEVEIDGAWRAATLVLDDGGLPGGTVAANQVSEFLGDAVWRFPAALELPLQHEHTDGVWRPVTPATCRELFLRSVEDVLLPHPRPGTAPVETYCPPGSLGEAVEAALHADGPDGLPERLRSEAGRMAMLLRAWHAEQAGAAVAAHRALRSRWDNWS